MKIVNEKFIKELKVKYPILNDITEGKEIFWVNLNKETTQEELPKLPISIKDIKDAEARLDRFSSYLRVAFPEIKASNGIIESKIKDIPNMKHVLKEVLSFNFDGNLLLKCDNDLPISGSIKARGGIYEVLKHAEDLALSNNLIMKEDDYSKFMSDEFRQFFSNYSISVGSTGNLGLSIGIISAKLGFNAYVHMSADAKKWKKDLLKQNGVTVIEYKSDYSQAVYEGRKQAKADPLMYFVDDENSINLFMGYAVAALRLEKQFKEKGIIVDENNPLFVYLPCGVGGGPGGVAFGLKAIFGDNVHCFFAEPTESACMTIGLLTGAHDLICVQDFGLSNSTDADGLAVGRASGFVGRTLENLISGAYTVKDENLYKYLALIVDSELIELEPSALAGIPGPQNLMNTENGKKYLEKFKLNKLMKSSTHLVWGTGGSMVTDSMKKLYYKTGTKYLNEKLDISDK